jgi:hypothetical protein
MTGDYRELIRRLQELVASGPSSELTHATASVSAFAVPIYCASTQSGPRILRERIGSIVAAVVDSVHCDGEAPLPEQAEKLVRRWIFSEVSSNGC